MPMFRGLSAFPLTPTNEAGEIQDDQLCRFLDRIVAAEADSIGLLGSTGGYAYLRREQRRRAVEVAVDYVGGRMPVVVGVGALRTDMAISLAQDAKAAGADGLLLAPVSYTPLTDDEVFQHLAAVAQAGALPLCIYNNPSTTRFTFSLPLIARLATLPNIAAVKMPLPAGGDFQSELAELRSLTPDTFLVGYSGDWGAADALLAGCDCWYSVIAGLLPEPALALTRAAQVGDAANTACLNGAFEPLWGLFREFGSFRVMYAIAAQLGFDKLSPPKPVQPIPGSDHERVGAAVNSLKQVAEQVAQSAA